MSSLPANIAQCSFFHPTGLRCGSPALRDSDRCYWHEQIAIIHHRSGPPSPFIDLPALDTPEAIQLAVMTVTQALVENRMKEKRAGLLLYAIQIAAANLRHMAKSKDIQEELLKQPAEGGPLNPAFGLSGEQALPDPVAHEEPEPAWMVETPRDREIYNQLKAKWDIACQEADRRGLPWPDFPEWPEEEDPGVVEEIKACVDETDVARAPSPASDRTPTTVILSESELRNEARTSRRTLRFLHCTQAARSFDSRSLATLLRARSG